MLRRGATVTLVIAGLIASSATALARGVGCSELPAYARAQGTLQMGEGACNMTIAEAMRIVRRERPDLYGPEVQPQPRAYRKHRRRGTGN